MPLRALQVPPLPSFPHTPPRSIRTSCLRNSKYAWSLSPSTVCCHPVSTHSVCGLCLASCSHLRPLQPVLSTAAVSPPGRSCSVAFLPWAWLMWVSHLDPARLQAPPGASEILLSPGGLLAHCVTSFRSLRKCHSSPPLRPDTAVFLPDPYPPAPGQLLSGVSSLCALCLLPMQWKHPEGRSSSLLFADLDSSSAH